MILDICTEIYREAHRAGFIRLDDHWSWYIPKFVEKLLVEEIYSRGFFPTNVYSESTKYTTLYNIDVCPGYELAIILAHEDYSLVDKKSNLIIRVDLELKDVNNDDAAGVIVYTPINNNRSLNETEHQIFRYKLVRK